MLSRNYSAANYANDVPNRVCCAPVEITPLDEKGIERVKLLFDWPRRILDILIVQVFCVLKNEEEEEEGRKGKNDEGMIKQTTNSFLMAKKQNYSTVIAVYLWMKKIYVYTYIHTHTHTYACNSVRERRSFVTRINCRNHRSFYKISKPFFIPNITIPTASLSLSLSRIIHKLIDFLRYKSSIGTYLFPPRAALNGQFNFSSFLFFFFYYSFSFHDI